MSISAFIFLSVVMVAFGYITSNAKNFNKWKFLVLALLLIPFANGFNFSQTHLFVILGSFLIGYLLPYAYLLDGFMEAISDAINHLRYRDAWKDIERREAEIEKKHQEFERARKHEAEKEKRKQEQQRRKKQSSDYRQSQKRADEGEKEQGQEKRKHDSSQYRQSQKQQKSNQKSTSSGNSPTARKCLRVLGLDSNKEYTFNEIKRAFRKMAKEYHSDINHPKNEAEKAEMDRLLRAVIEAYEWLGKHYIGE